MDELEKKFNKAIIDGCEEARKLGYRPSQFLQMIGDYGALGAAKRIISKPGFVIFCRLAENIFLASKKASNHAGLLYIEYLLNPKDGKFCNRKLVF